MKRSKRIILILLIIGTICLSIFAPIKIKADSGFDFDYDSGGGWDSDWGSDFGGSSYSGTFDEIDFIIFIIVVIVITYVIVKAYSNTNQIGSERIPKISEDEIKKYLPNFNEQQFLDIAYTIFEEVQIAWMNFDIEKIKKYVSDDLYNMYVSQLNTLKIKGQKNIMENFQKKTIYVKGIREENGKVALDVLLIVSFKDYIVDQNNRIIRGDKSTYTTTYKLTYVVSQNISKEITCPNCHAKINMNHTDKCEYCDSILVNDSFDYILTQKQFINKRR